MPASMPATRVWGLLLHQAVRRECCIPDVTAFVFKGSRSSCLLYLYQARSSTLLMVAPRGCQVCECLKSADLASCRWHSVHGVYVPNKISKPLVWASVRRHQSVPTGAQDAAAVTVTAVPVSQRSNSRWSMGHALHMKVHPSADLRSHSFVISRVSSGIECSSRKRLRLNVLSSGAGDSRVPPEADVHYRRSGAAAMSPAWLCMSRIPPSRQQMHLIALQARLVCAACLHLSTSIPQLPCSRSSLYHICFCFACSVSICLVSPCMVIPSIDAGAICEVPYCPGSAT